VCGSESIGPGWRAAQRAGGDRRNPRQFARLPWARLKGPLSTRFGQFRVGKVALFA
jgi:hypothetical protein